MATLANIGFPGTISFVGEFLLMFSFIVSSKAAFFFNALGFFVSITYAFWLYNRISFLLPFYVFVFSDLSRREFCLLFPLIFLVFFLGLFPSVLLNTMEFSALSVLHLSNFLFYGG